MTHNEIDDSVDRWHAGDGRGRSLDDYLGLDRDTYAAWAEGRTADCHECGGSGVFERDPSGAYTLACPVCDGRGWLVTPRANWRPKGARRKAKGKGATGLSATEGEG